MWAGDILSETATRWSETAKERLKRAGRQAREKGKGEKEKAGGTGRANRQTPSHHAIYPSISILHLLLLCVCLHHSFPSHVPSFFLILHACVSSIYLITPLVWPYHLYFVSYRGAALIVVSHIGSRLVDVVLRAGVSACCLGVTRRHRASRIFHVVVGKHLVCRLVTYLRENFVFSYGLGARPLSRRAALITQNHRTHCIGGALI